MRARYQTKPGIAVFGMIFSLGLIFGASEVMSRSAATQVNDVEAASVGESLGVGMVDLTPAEVDVGTGERSC